MRVDELYLCLGDTQREGALTIESSDRATPTRRPGDDTWRRKWRRKRERLGSDFFYVNFVSVFTYFVGQPTKRSSKSPLFQTHLKRSSSVVEHLLRTDELPGSAVGRVFDPLKRHPSSGDLLLFFLVIFCTFLAYFLHIFGSFRFDFYVSKLPIMCR